MTNSFFFWLGLSALMVHEMDAVQRKEWRILPFLSRLDDQRGFVVFTLAHIPLYAAILMGLAAEGSAGPLRLALDVFMVIHVGLHYLLRHAPRNEFNNRFSWSIIIGAGVAGGIDALLLRA